MSDSTSGHASRPSSAAKEAVSYTHLGIAAGQGRLAFLLGVVPGVLLIGNGLGGAHQGLTDRPVSYTHLDVYKRQAYNGVDKHGSRHQRGTDIRGFV